ncbi:hypothetical protein [Pseudarthrobacter sp. fls2-241-R2A-127]|uniref:hypothetical protein n=1 Tax=Pseudarthrobacter sp. fls2-241-R2A-127 TaxID=3040303 RepID=UPI0025540ABC|nr:hypothetical protein [Pseudarthrobacter sp. fls2-241-R2A-127]
METLKKIVTNQYFPAGSVLAAVLLFWVVGLLGGLSLLNNNQPPLTTLTWLLFVYSAAVLSPVAGLVAGIDLVRRWRRNRAAAPETRTEAEAGGFGDQTASDSAAEPAAPAEEAAQPSPAAPQTSRPPLPAKKPRQSGREAA